MNFGIREPTHVRFSMPFGEAPDMAAIKMIGVELEFDGWSVEFHDDINTMIAERECKVGKIGEPTIIQGPPDPAYMGKRAFDAYCQSVGGKTFDDKPIMPWSELAERQKNGWIAAAMEILP